MDTPSKTERSVVALVKRDKTEKKGKLYVVVVGVEKYPFLPTDCNGRSCDLAYPVDDAAEILGVLKQRTAPLFSGMVGLALTAIVILGSAIILKVQSFGLRCAFWICLVTRPDSMTSSSFMPILRMAFFTQSAAKMRIRLSSRDR